MAEDASKIDLPYLPIDRSDFAENPFSFMAEARAHHPWLARFDAGYVVYGQRAIQDLMFMDDKLAAGFGGVVDFYQARGTLWGRFMDEMLLSSSGAAHSRLRNSVRNAFTPRHAKQMRPVMRKVVADLLDTWIPRGAFDFAVLSAQFPVSVMCALLGVSSEAVGDLNNALETQVASLSLNPDLKPHFMAAFDTLWRFADELVLEREKSGAVDADSLLDTLIAVRNSGEMDDIELRFMVLVLLLAGYDTSKNMLTMIVYQLLDRPDDWKRCADDIGYCAKVVEEAFRYSTVATSFRTALEDVDYDGIRFPKGSLIAMAFPLAGRDPTAFPDPDRFDPERVHANRHAAFGRGIHICIGMYIARNQLEEGLHLIAQRIGNPHVNGKIGWRPFPGVWGPGSLPIAFDPRAARED